MSPETMEALTPELILQLSCLTVLSAAGLRGVHRGRFAVLSFRRPVGPLESPLLSLPEMALVFVSLFLAQIVVVPFLMPLLGYLDGLFLSVATFASHAVFFVFLCWFVRSILGQPLAVLGLRRTSVFNLLPMALVYVFSFCPLQLVGAVWLLLLQSVGVEPALQEPTEHFTEALSNGEQVTVGTLAFLAVVVAPLIEEILFRGVIFGGLAARWGVWPAAVVSGLTFAAIHFSLTAFLPLFFLALILCYLYARTGSLFTAIAFHALFNGVSLTFLAFVDSL